MSKKHKKTLGQDKLKVRVRQSDDGSKKKIRIYNDCFEVKVRVKDQECEICKDDKSVFSC
ncbi:hypothetical protein [Candidatus Formimonas warabiya]|uniref:Uncharacterized protein n=1 Tax=Formimonas warabiya TaxID=1761012 RepID=A0A3G1KS05_FORW1|nr:hypothetical protein [Candidatus Formimonas warabiya]ATW25238.1 hypothetical protein DCMF_11080 [Candidatus Formimonas warabiya]